MTPLLVQNALEAVCSFRFLKAALPRFLKSCTPGMTRGAQSEALSRQGPNSVVRLGAALDSVVWGLL
jgi:hypothetical protein